jgi:hypothetical protein
MYTLDFPNKEVYRSFSIHLLSEFNGGKTDQTNQMLNILIDSIENEELEKFRYIEAKTLLGTRESFDEYGKG